MRSPHRVLTLGDLLVEIMREKVGEDLKTPGIFEGPFPSGAPAIFAGALSALGVKVSIIGSVGNDEFGNAILDRLRSHGVDVNKVQILNDYTTGVAFVTYFYDGSRKFIFHVDKSAAGQVNQRWINKTYLHQFTHLHVMGTSLAINENWRRFTLQVLAIVKQRGATVSFDPNLRPDMLRDEKLREPYLNVLKNTDIFLPGEEELQQLTGIADCRKAAHCLIDSGVKVVAVKRGAAGSLIVARDVELECAAYEVEEVDPTGAGDCYDAGFLKGYLEGWSWKQIGEFANAVGALAVSKRGPMEGISDVASVQRFTRNKSKEEAN